MKQYFGNYLGLVVNAQDPENRGRVQVFVPGLIPSLYSNWDEKLKNISFKTFESETFSDDLKIRLLTHLPWAEAAIPFWGGSTGAPINESTGAPTPMPTDQGFNYAIPPDGAAGGGFDPAHERLPGKIRNRPVNQALADTISAGLRGTGLNWVSTSGTGNYGVPGSQHRVGNASDGYFTDEKGRTLDAAIPADRDRISYALWSLTRAGITGVGWGDGVSNPGGRYMGSTIFHLDIGSRYANWGNDKGNTAPAPWVVSARQGNPQRSPISTDPPTEAYADTRKAEVDMLATPTGEPTGKTVDVGTGLMQSFSTALQKSLNLGSNQLANNAAIAYRTAFNEAIARGATQQQANIVASAIVGNIKQESNFNPNTIHDGGRGYGLLGEQGPHLTRMLQYAATKGENRNTGVSVQTQIEALFREPDFLNGRPSSSGFPAWRGLTTLFNAGSVEEAARLFSGQTLNPTTGWGYLRPGNPRIENRIANAVNANQAFSSLGAADLVAAVEGQNVLRTRTPDFYGSIDGMRTGAPMGYTSLPYVGSKVWVFFNGGDLQRPVYFATIYETENIV